MAWLIALLILCVVCVRLSWSQYFSERGVTAAFWSAQLAEQEATTTTTEMASTDVDDNMGGEPLSSGAENETESVGTSASPEILSSERLLQLFRDLSLVPGERKENKNLLCVSTLTHTRTHAHTHTHTHTHTAEGGITTVGLVGYPNVGKSSTINVLYQEKKVYCNLKVVRNFCGFMEKMFADGCAPP